LVSALEALVDPGSRGDPQSPLRWTTKSTSRLAGELASAGYAAVDRTVARLLRQSGYSLQGNAKTIEGTQHPDRDAQFLYITARVVAFQAEGDPVISVDTKKKELVGNFANGGAEWEPAGDPRRVNVHDFADKELGKAVPYGVYDLTANTGWVNVGRRHRRIRGRVDPPLVAHRRQERLPAREEAADHRRLGRVQRQPAAAVEDRACRVRRPGRARDHGAASTTRNLEMEPDRTPPVQLHFDELARPPAGVSRGHHRDDRGDHHQDRADRTRHAGHQHLPRGIKITDKQMKEFEAAHLARHEFHGDWNYTIAGSTNQDTTCPNKQK
jgi:hypothetical protein